MAADVLAHGPERPSRRRPAGLAVLVLAVVVAGAVHGGGDQPTTEPTRPPGAVLERAGVLSLRETLAGALHIRIEVAGAPRARLSSVDLDLPGSAVHLLPAPDRLTDDGRGLLVADLLPRCPEALDGLARAAVSAFVSGQAGDPPRRVRVALETDGQLVAAVRRRCGTASDVPGLRTSLAALDGPPGEVLRTRVEASATGAERIAVVAVEPGPGLEVSLRTALPVVLAPGGAPVPIRVDLRLEGCGGSRDTPPYLLVLSSGDAVPVAVAPELQPPLARLRPYQCAG